MYGKKRSGGGHREGGEFGCCFWGAEPGDRVGLPAVRPRAQGAGGTPPTASAGLRRPGRVPSPKRLPNGRAQPSPPPRTPDHPSPRHSSNIHPKPAPTFWLIASLRSSRPGPPTRHARLGPSHAKQAWLAVGDAWAVKFWWRGKAGKRRKGLERSGGVFSSPARARGPGGWGHFWVSRVRSAFVVRPAGVRLGRLVLSTSPQGGGPGIALRLHQ